MGDVYLREHKPARSQFRSPRRSRPTGLTVVHTAESVMDTVGPDTGAENVAEFIRRRSEPGSYHDLVDSDSDVQLVRYSDEAFQDGTGSNRYALSISFALKAADWPRLSLAKRDAFLEQAAVAFHRQQAWLRAHGYPVTPLRRISRAASELGHAGFITHAERDPDRRKDPGAAFPWLRFLQILTPPPGPAPLLEEDDVARLIKAPDKGATFGTDGTQRWHVPSPPVLKELVAIGLYGDGKTHTVSQETIDALPLVERAQ
jgi:hypothetical protein